ncbi:MAG TPA: alpha/beta hydrolase [Pseudonocardia sp.]|nr:alpha/beta hydrolase [Pseudonocardia sp.]
MPTVRTRAGELAYDELGTGAPLLLVHSAAHDRRDWDAIRTELAGRYRTVAVDLPAHGESPAPRSDWQPSAAGIADLVEDVVDRLGLGPTSVLGSSVGGFAAARLAIRRPEAVRALVLVDHGGFGDYPLGVRLFCRALGLPPLLRLLYPGFARTYMRSSSAHDRAVLREAQRLRRRPARAEVVAGLWRSFPGPEHSLESRAGEITAPTLIVWGRRDPVIPISAGRRAGELIPGARFVSMDTGHLPFTSDPAGFLAHVLPFLAAVPAG